MLGPLLKREDHMTWPERMRKDGELPPMNAWDSTSASRFFASEAALRFGLDPLLLLNSSCSLCASLASSSAGLPICM